MARYRILDEKDKLARLCAQIASFDHEDSGGGGEDPEGDEAQDRRSHFDEMLKLSGELGEEGTGVQKLALKRNPVPHLRSAL